MSSAISYKAEIIYRMGDGKLGLLRHDEIDIVWKDFDESLRPQFLQMFHDYKLAYPLYDSRGQPLNASIVPAMLPDEPLGGGLSPTEDDLKNLYFPLNCKKQASVRLECDYLPVALIPKAQVCVYYYYYYYYYQLLLSIIIINYFVFILGEIKFISNIRWCMEIWMFPPT